ncbi:MAG TPA: DUF547 domain-containing protein [Eudoraea sp.]|nr:DUF547 domain-containing protein [Eudoraea sp.]
MAYYLIMYCVLSALCNTQAPLSNTHISDVQTDFNRLSEKFVRNLMNGSSTNDIRARLYTTTPEELEEQLKTDQQKLAFWVNIYNGYIQVILSEHPEFYSDRRAFFKREQIPIAGRLISFAKIEHGIIRDSQWELGLGRIGKWFPDAFERKLRVDERDYRIHFALNCGAKDCPPVAVYEAEQLDSQFKKATAQYLRRTSEYSEEKKQVAVTSLFSWFRGDFGGKSGIKEILKSFHIIPQTNDIDITYKNYDWTLDLHNFAEL